MNPVIDKSEIDAEKTKVKARIDELINNILPFYRAERSKHAEQGDLRENVEYENAISSLQKAEAELVSLQHKFEALSNMGLENYVPTGFVGIGSTVTIRRHDNGELLHFLVVVPELGDADKKRLPVNSMLGKAILGKEAGAEVWVRTSSRKYYATIESVA
jgi:transcription elongation GreA/GreB family factor